MGWQVEPTEMIDRETEDGKAKPAARNWSVGAKSPSCPSYSAWAACRHGGMTELEEAEYRRPKSALSAHTSKAYEGYAKRTMMRAFAATRKRLSRSRARRGPRHGVGASMAGACRCSGAGRRTARARMPWASAPGRTIYASREQSAPYSTKLRYDASASIWSGDKLFAICGIGNFAAVWNPSPHCSSRLFR